jgi:hypothetical protein
MLLASQVASPSPEYIPESWGTASESRSGNNTTARLRSARRHANGSRRHHLKGGNWTAQGNALGHADKK